MRRNYLFTSLKRAHTSAKSTLLLLFVLLLIAFVCPASAVGGPDEYRLRLVQFVHRHGSRSAEVSYIQGGNESKICIGLPCGLLNSYGKQQLYNVGNFLRQRYNGTVDDGVSIATGFLPAAYDETFVYTRSTDMPRTLQSADALLSGMFNGPTPVYPVVHTVPMTSEQLLIPLYLPNIAAAGPLGRNVWVREQANQIVDSIFLTHEDLLAVAREVYSEGRCSDYNLRASCAQQLFDIAASYEPSGLLANFPLLSANYPDLIRVNAAMNTASYSYYPNEELQRNSGSQGQVLVQAMLQNIQDSLVGKTNFKMFHYSAHDATVAPVAATLGENDDNSTFSPPFGAIIVLELLERIDDSALYARILRGVPGRTPESDYNYTSWPIPMRCINSDGNLYVMNSTNINENICPLQDFIRFVDSTKGVSAMGFCYLTPEMRAGMNCSGGGAAPSSACRSYRRQCPAYACGEGEVLEAVTGACAPAPASASASVSTPAVEVTCKGGSDLSSGGVAGIAIATFVIGLLLAGVFGFVIYHPTHSLRGGSKRELSSV